MVSKKRLVQAVLAIVVLSPVLMVALLFLDRTEVRAEAELPQVSFGLPVPWVSQDMSGLDPSQEALPLAMSFGAPQEYATSLVASGTIASFVLCALALGIVAACLVALRRASTGVAKKRDDAERQRRSTSG